MLQETSEILKHNEHTTPKGENVMYSKCIFLSSVNVDGKKYCSVTLEGSIKGKY